MEEKHSGKFTSGLLWGLIVGGTLALLFSTKKGKKILREISEAGIEAIENLSNIETQEEHSVEESQVRESPPDQELESLEKKDNGEKKVRRFFKGIKRK